MPLTSTTWADLKSLGWQKSQIYNILNEKRDGTISTVNDISLNEGFAKRNNESCLNTFKGQAPQVPEKQAAVTKKGKLLWAHTNPKGAESVFSDIYKASSKETTRVDAVVTEPPAIRLGSVTVDFSGLELSLEFRNDDGFHTDSQDTEATKQHVMPLLVLPGETLRVYSQTTTQISVQEVYVAYGFTDESKIGTYGEPFKDESYWSYTVNKELGNPERTMKVKATLTKTIVEPTLERLDADGKEIPSAHKDPEVPDITPTKESEENDPDATADTPGA